MRETTRAIRARTRSPKARLTSLVAGLTLIAGLSVVFAAAALANHAGPPSGRGIAPEYTPGNHTCAELRPGTVEFKIENPRDGTYSDGTLTVEIDVQDTAAGPVFEWESNFSVDSIFVKGGPNGNLYRYAPERDSDTNLHSPVNHANDKFYGLSHLSFCYYAKAKKSGMKFEDKDGDGVKDAGEPGLAGWKIHLFGANDSDHQVATTDAEGKYAFYVKPGSYTVCEEQQTGWTQSYPTAGGADCSGHTHSGTITSGAKGYAITLTSGQDDKDNDFGNYKKAKKSGMKFEDKDGDGVKGAGEVCVDRWNIRLRNAVGSIHEVAHTHGGTSSPGAKGYAITLTSGQDDKDNDFGNYKKAKKSGMKFEDKDGDGVKDAGEPGLAG